MAREFCKHYRGMHRKTFCEAGVLFESLPFRGTPQFSSECPCFGPAGALNCEHAIYPTAEEQAAENAEMIMNQCLLDLANSRNAIVAHLGGPWKRGMPGASGSIDCPICKQTQSLQFSRASCNGHIHAACKTDGCVRWME